MAWESQHLNLYTAPCMSLGSSLVSSCRKVVMGSWEARMLQGCSIGAMVSEVSLMYVIVHVVSVRFVRFSGFGGARNFFSSLLSKSQRQQTTDYNIYRHTLTHTRPAILLPHLSQSNDYTMSGPTSATSLRLSFSDSLTDEFNILSNVFSKNNNNSDYIRLLLWL